MKRSERRSDCPINFAVQTFGDAWSLVILRDLMFTERRTYGDFLAAEEGISTNILAARLEHLKNVGLVVRRESRYAAANASGGDSRWRRPRPLDATPRSPMTR